MSDKPTFLKLTSAASLGTAATRMRLYVGPTIRFFLSMDEEAAFAQRLIAEDLPGLMENSLAELPDISFESFGQAAQCTRHLPSVVRSLNELERLQWASLLVRILRQAETKECES